MGSRSRCFPSCSGTLQVPRPCCTPGLQGRLHAASRARPGLQAEARHPLSNKSRRRTEGLSAQPPPSAHQRLGTRLAHVLPHLTRGLGPGVSHGAGLAPMEQWERLWGNAAPPEAQGCSSVVIQQTFHWGRPLGCILFPLVTGSPCCSESGCRAGHGGRRGFNLVSGCGDGRICSLTLCLHLGHLEHHRACDPHSFRSSALCYPSLSGLHGRQACRRSGQLGRLRTGRNARFWEQGSWCMSQGHACHRAGAEVQTLPACLAHTCTSE